MQIDAQTTANTKLAISPSIDTPSPAATAPGQLRVIKRNGAVVGYDASKISVAITKAYLEVEGGNAADSTRIHESVAQLAIQITDLFDAACPPAAPSTSKIFKTKLSWL